MRKQERDRIKARRDGLVARIAELEKAVDASIDYLGVYCHQTPNVSEMIEALSNCKAAQPRQSLDLLRAEVLEEFANKREALLEGIPLGLESRKHGASLYNWENHFCCELVREATALRNKAEQS